jgi:hypothetical protein
MNSSSAKVKKVTAAAKVSSKKCKLPFLSVFHLILTTTPAKIKLRKDSSSSSASLTAIQAVASESTPSPQAAVLNMAWDSEMDVLQAECGEVLPMDWVPVNGAASVGLVLSQPGACFLNFTFLMLIATEPTLEDTSRHSQALNFDPNGPGMGLELDFSDFDMGGVDAINLNIDHERDSDVATGNFGLNNFHFNNFDLGGYDINNGMVYDSAGFNIEDTCKEAKLSLGPHETFLSHEANMSFESLSHLPLPPKLTNEKI